MDWILEQIYWIVMLTYAHQNWCFNSVITSIIRSVLNFVKVYQDFFTWRYWNSMFGYNDYFPLYCIVASLQLCHIVIDYKDWNLTFQFYFSWKNDLQSLFFLIELKCCNAHIDIVTSTESYTSVYSIWFIILYQEIRRDFIQNEVVNWELGMHIYGYLLQVRRLISAAPSTVQPYYLFNHVVYSHVLTPWLNYHLNIQI